MLNSVNYKLYADDTVLYYSARTIGECNTHLSRDMSNFAKWCRGNKLTLNLKKTKEMVFASRPKIKNLVNTPAKSEGIPLDNTPTYKYLGFILDSVLNFSKHMSQLRRNVTHKSHLLSRIRINLDAKASINTYKTMSVPYFDYGDCIYDGANANQLERLQSIQNRSLRITLKRDRLSHVDELHADTGVMYLSKRRRLNLAKMAFKRAQMARYRDERAIPTRAHDGILLKVIRPKCAKYTKSVSYKAAILWNGLNADLRNTTTLPAFIEKVKVAI